MNFHFLMLIPFCSKRNQGEPASMQICTTPAWRRGDATNDGFPRSSHMDLLDTCYMRRAAQFDPFESNPCCWEKAERRIRALWICLKAQSLAIEEIWCCSRGAGEYFCFKGWKLPPRVLTLHPLNWKIHFDSGRSLDM